MEIVEVLSFRIVREFSPASADSVFLRQRTVSAPSRGNKVNVAVKG